MFRRVGSPASAQEQSIGAERVSRSLAGVSERFDFISRFGDREQINGERADSRGEAPSQPVRLGSCDRA